jgi:hypothetical protein
LGGYEALHEAVQSIAPAPSVTVPPPLGLTVTFSFGGGC